MIGDLDYTQEQVDAILGYIGACHDLEVAEFQKQLKYKMLVKALGEKARCTHCGVKHWPLCDEEEGDEYELDDTDHMP